MRGDTLSTAGQDQYLTVHGAEGGQTVEGMHTEGDLDAFGAADSM